MALDLNLSPSAPFFPIENEAPFHFIAWNPPSDDAWKLNFAVSTLGEFKLAGAGWVLRDQNAIFKAASAAPLQANGSTLEVELSALESGLFEAMKQGVDYLEVEGDSPAVILTVLGRITPDSSSTEQLLNKCNSILQKFRRVSLHIVRDYVNRAANKLADMGAYLEEPMHWLEKPPSAISQILIEDVIGYYA